jgi:hypothetical protein
MSRFSIDTAFNDSEDKIGVRDPSTVSTDVSVVSPDSLCVSPSSSQRSPESHARSPQSEARSPTSSAMLSPLTARVVSPRSLTQSHSSTSTRAMSAIGSPSAAENFLHRQRNLYRAFSRSAAVAVPNAGGPGSTEREFKVPFSVHLFIVPSPFPLPFSVHLFLPFPSPFLSPSQFISFLSSLLLSPSQFISFLSSLLFLSLSVTLSILSPSLPFLSSLLLSHSFFEAISYLTLFSSSPLLQSTTSDPTIATATANPAFRSSQWRHCILRHSPGVPLLCRPLYQRFREEGFRER